MNDLRVEHLKEVVETLDKFKDPLGLTPWEQDFVRSIKSHHFQLDEFVSTPSHRQVDIILKLEEKYL
jgi:hypothetical protein